MLLKFVVAILALLAVNVSLADDEVVSGPTKESKQFDFWLGDWKVVNRRINGNNIWKQFGIAKAEIHSALDGKVIIEQWTGQGDYVLRGFSLRTYDEEEKRWEVASNWHSGTSASFSFTTGNFSDGRGEFFRPEDPRQTRFSFSKVLPESCQWESAHLKNGKWTPNWTMDFTRTGPPDSIDAANLPIRLPADYLRNSNPENRQLDRLIGSWKGNARRLKDDGSWEEGSAVRRVTSVIDGFALLQLTSFSWGEESVSAIAFDSNDLTWHSIGTSSSELDCHRLEGIGEKATLRLNETDASDNGYNHVWLDMSQDSFDWQLERIVSKSSGESQKIVEVSFQRDGLVGRIEVLPLPQLIDLDSGMRLAQTAINEKKYWDAEALLRSIVSQEYRNYKPRFLLGYTLHVQGKYAEAMVLYQTTISSPQYGALSHYNIACIHSLRNETDKSLQRLRAAIDAGYEDYEAIKADSDFDNIRDEKRFQEIISGKK